MTKNTTRLPGLLQVFRYRLRTMLVAFTSLALAFAFHESLQISYHLWAANRAAQTKSSVWYAGPYDYHIDKLVHLKQFEKQTFSLKHLRGDSQAIRNLASRLVQERAGLFNMEIERSPDSVVISCHPDDSQAYTILIKEQRRSDQGYGT